MQMDKEKNLYELVCKRRFDNVEGDTKEIIRLLRGRNGDPGLIDDVRDLKKARMAVAGVLMFVVTVLGVQGLNWLWERIFGK